MTVRGPVRAYRSMSGADAAGSCTLIGWSSRTGACSVHFVRMRMPTTSMKPDNVVGSGTAVGGPAQIAICDVGRLAQHRAVESAAATQEAIICRRLRIGATCS